MSNVTDSMRPEEIEDLDREMADLGARLNDALRLAKRLHGRGVDMVRIGLDLKEIERLRDEAENAYVFRKAPARTAK